MGMIKVSQSFHEVERRSQISKCRHKLNVPMTACCRRLFNMDCRISLQVLILLWLFNVGAGSIENSQCNSYTIVQNPANGVCSSIDIRNKVSELRKLENCTVIEGSLHISLIDAPKDPKEYDNYSFPNLVEITDHLMLYRVMGLRTLSRLFPNLTVIKGQSVFSNYALVAYEMSDLEEVGLHSLRVIGNGGVRLTKNKKLCYVNTVDWIRIGANPDFLDFKDNRIESRCVNQCPNNCDRTSKDGKDSPRCWNQHQCQRGLNCQCKEGQACMANGSCCHEYCRGGCTGPGPGDCLSCKGVTYKGKCEPKCPPETYMFYNRRCLTDKECLELPPNDSKKSKLLRGNDDEQENLCLYTCKEGYSESESKNLKSRECVKCKGFCPKECTGIDIHSLEDAMKLKGCSKVKGPIIIQIIGGSNVALQLEEFLGSIKEITGYVSIRRSYALLTLNFLKSLEIIGGETTGNLTYSFIVMDNSNLQELFPEEQMKRMVIKEGRVSFHSNRKLCLSKINQFVSLVNISKPPEENDISKTTNGDLKPCSETYLNLSIDAIHDDSVVLRWQKDTADSRHLLSYIVNYKEVKDKDQFDVDIFQGRDACSDDVWMSKEQTPTADDEPDQKAVIFPLKAYTSYAVYVQSYTLSTAAHIAMTKVRIFTTQPSNPSEPLNVQVFAENPGELRITWKPPKNPNGNVTHYKIMYKEQTLDEKVFEHRNYCQDPIVLVKEEEETEVAEEEKVQNLSANCCACPKSKDEKDEEKRVQDIEIYFEDYLQRHVFCKRFPNGLPTYITISEDYNLLNILQANFNAVNESTTSKPQSKLEKKENTTLPNNQTNVEPADRLMETVTNETHVILPNLKHFQEYAIQIIACHDTKVESKSGESNALCSSRALNVGRTKYIPEKDTIDVANITVDIAANNSGDAIIKWDPPKDPNGLILKYNLYYKKANKDNIVPTEICVNIQQYKKLKGYTLMGLGPGNWTFQIKPVSLAGNGTLTPEKFFIIQERIESSGSNKAIIALGVIGAVLLIIFILAITYVVVKQKMKNNAMTVISPNMNYVPSEHMYIMDDWEVDRDKIKLIKELGTGSFGMVYEGIAKGIGEDPEEEIRVAVKTVNDRASFNDKREFLKEATTMKAFDCYHVVKLLGVVSTGQPALVIMELMALGDLKNYLRHHRPDEIDNPGVTPPKLFDILQMAGEIADGMAYLADKKFVHRDLAARNCMVAEDRTVKVGDFGMTRDIYETDYYRKGGKGMMPVRWMAPESLRDGVFTTMSDVWSYGVVMWEMVTLAAQPYQGLSNEEVVRYVSEGNIMDMPEKCPEEMAYLMEHCWCKKPSERPTFKAIIEYLMPHLNSKFEKVSYFFNEGGGPSEGGGDLSDHYEEDEDEEEGSEARDSIASLSCEGAAASASVLRSPNKQQVEYHEEVEHNGFGDPAADRLMDSDEDAPDSSLFNNSDFGATGGDWELPTRKSSGSFPARSSLFTNSLEPSPLGNGSGFDPSLENRRFELQPLINKEEASNPSQRSPKLSILPLPLPSSLSDPSPTDSQSTDQVFFRPGTSTDSSPPQVDYIRGSPASDWSRRTPAQSSPSTKISSRPVLRLPTLNQPPGGGFRRVPLTTSSGNSSDSEKTKTGQRPPRPPSPASLDVAMEEGGLDSPSSTGAIVSSSNEGSKESSKSSGSHSLLNGLTNGHIPLTPVNPRTAPC